MWDGRRHRPVASEAGHADWAPQDELQVALWRFLAGEVGHVSVERVLSGPGLYNIYRFLRDAQGLAEPGWLTDALRSDAPAPVISQAALEGRAEICGRALALFVAIYGAEAGNLGLRLLATGGVYLGGGIAPRILPALRSRAFLDAFGCKGRLRSLLETIPVRVVLNDQAALLGAAVIGSVTTHAGAVTGSVSGIVTDGTTGAPLSGFAVAAYDSTGGNAQFVSTNGSGVFSFPNLAAGTYFIRTHASALGNQNYIDEVYNNLACWGCDVTSGAPIAVTNGSAVLAHVDGRSAWMRRFRDLIATPEADLGGRDTLSEGQRAIVRRAALLQCQLERMETHIAQNDGEAGEKLIDCYQRTSGGLRRLLESIGLNQGRKQRDVTTLGDLLREDLKRQQREEAS